MKRQNFEKHRARDRSRERGASCTIDVLALGGTIAMARGEQGARPALTGRELVESVPDLKGLAEIRVSTVRQTGSPNLGLKDALELKSHVEKSRATGAMGCVVTQGTDTLEEIAFVLDMLLEPGPPVVFTGALRNSSLPGADGAANLLDAVRVATADEAADRGVLVAMNGVVHGARHVHKSHTYAVEAFSSAPSGPVGWICEGRVHLTASLRERAPTLAIDSDAELPYVGLYATFGGDDGRLLDAFRREDVAALVVQGLGVGHVPEGLAVPLEQLASERPVVYASRICVGGSFRATYGYVGGDMDLWSRGLICAGELSAPKARILLAALLAAGADRARIERAFDR